MFIVQTADMERLIISNKFLDELRALPEGHLSSKDAQCDRHLGSYTTLDVVKQSDLHSDVCRALLTKYLGTLVPLLFEEIKFALGQVSLVKCVPSSEGSSKPFSYPIWSLDLTVISEYEYFPIYPMMVSTINRVMSRALVGYPMCRNENWLSTAIGYTMSAFAISATSDELLRPLLAERASTGSRIDFLQWLVDGAIGKGQEDPKRLIHKALFIGLAATNASNMGVVNFILDLCAMPEYIQPLREELQKCTRDAGGWNLAAIQNMELLDSFLKESQCTSHPGIFSYNRKVLKPIILSNGTVLAKGTFIAMPTYFIARDPAYLTTSYDFKLPEGQTERPESTFADERIMPSRTQLLITSSYVNHGGFEAGRPWRRRNAPTTFKPIVEHTIVPDNRASRWRTTPDDLINLFPLNIDPDERKAANKTFPTVACRKMKPAPNVIEIGKFKTSVFKLSGNDILVISIKYVDEIRNIPKPKLSSIQANIDNFEGLYSTTSILLEGHLHTDTIQRRLTPKLGTLVSATEKELTSGLKAELPAGTVHTTSMAATQTLFDICARPEYIVPLQEEVLQAVIEDGVFQKPTLMKLRRESQRMNPPSQLGFKRAIKVPLTLSDGVILPKNIYLMVPVAPVVMDPSIVPNPTDFSGFRHYELRQRPREHMRHQFATTSRDNLHFGHGKYSCPGRFFASNTIKMILSRLLLDFDFKFPGDGELARPQNVALRKHVFLNPEARMLFREKKTKP
ncbi:hypothetical protein G7Y89_g1617 [Cudoniella acicularis]|uniref:Cytochrome P450 n=1 Tax=Cudoniella acicularis TaxID=354080 RepID=A0A8H4W9D3_9HELO|nr:hypothetical protein G7Y89_g1617 [Cudoniella acicularis]